MSSNYSQGVGQLEGSGRLGHVLAVLGEFAQARAVNQCLLRRRYQDLKASSQLLIEQKELDTGPVECGSNITPSGSCVGPLPQCEGNPPVCMDVLLQSLQVNIDVAAAELSRLEVRPASWKKSSSLARDHISHRVLICEHLQESGQSQEDEIKSLLKTRDALEGDRGLWGKEDVSTNEYAMMLEVHPLAGLPAVLTC